MAKTFQETEWALILGGSSGFGLATATKLAPNGMSVCVVHRDRRGAMERIEKEFAEIRANGAGFLALNVDALATEGVATVLSVAPREARDDRKGARAPALDRLRQP